MLLYEALALKDGNVQALPVKIHGRTLAQERLGPDNLLRVKFEGPDLDEAAKKHQLAVLTDGLALAGRAYRLYCRKDDHVWFLAVGGRWPTAEAARSSLADFADTTGFSSASCATRARRRPCASNEARADPRIRRRLTAGRR